MTTGAAVAPPRLIIFDLDGTLIDSIGDIAASANQSLAEAYGESARLSKDVVRGFVGSGARQLIERCLDAAGESSGDVPRVFERFLAIYRSRLTDTTRLYPGLDEALSRLALSSRFAILTNKPGDISRAIVEALGLTDRFIANIGGGDLETKKPDPEGLLKIAADAGVALEDTAMVGDSAIDVQTARNARVLSVAVLWGYDSEGARAASPDVVVEKTLDLPDAILNARRALAPRQE